MVHQRPWQVSFTSFGSDTLIFAPTQYIWATFICRFRTVASDSPLITAHRSLSDFITEVGLPPSQDSVETWANRMREQGNDVSCILKRIQQHGAALHEQVFRPVKIV